MIKRYHLLKLLLVVCVFSYAQPPEYVWTKAIQGSGSEYNYALCTDSKGYVYAAGGFTGTADLDPGSGSLMATSSPSQQIGYVCKFDPLGNLIWAKWLDGIVRIQSICVDDHGNVYTAGTFQNILDMDPSTSVYTITPQTGALAQSCFIWKLSASGQFLTVGEFGGGSSGNVALPRIKIDGQQNLFCTGSYMGSADIDPGPGVTTVTFSAPNAYMLKLDQSLNLSWSGLFRSQSFTFIGDVEYDTSGNPNIELTAGVTGTIDIDPGPSVTAFNCNQKSNNLIIKLNSSGNLVSFIHAAESGVNCSLCITNGGGFGLEIDNNNDVFLKIGIIATVAISPANNPVSLGGNQVYLLHFTPTGTLVKYDTLNIATTVFEIHNDTLFLGGAFSGTFDFDPSAATSTATSVGGQDVFMLALDKSFQLQWLKTYGGSGPDYVNSLAFSNPGELYVAGQFSNTCDFDPGTTTMTITAQAGYDTYISKFSPCRDMPYVTPDYSMCAGGSASLSAYSTTVVSWYQSATGGTALATGSVYTTPVLSTGNYTYFVSAESCSLMPRTQVVVDAQPIPTLTIASPSGSICLGNSATLTATGASSFQWSGGPSTPKYIVKPTQNTVYSVTGSHTLNSCASTKTVSVLVSECVGLTEISAERWRIYPNPTTGMLNIEGSQYNCIEVYDITGKNMLRINPESNRESIDLTNLPRGVYMLYIKSEDHTEYHKLIKDR